MKRYGAVVLAALLMSASVPVFADEMGGAKETKDECLLVAKDCQGSVDSLQQRIAKLNSEIAKGEKVYSKEDLKRLDEKVKEANDFLDKMTKNP